MGSGDVTAYGLRAGGGRNLGVKLSGVQVLLSPDDETRQRDAEGIAASLLKDDADREALRARLRVLESEVAELRGHLQRAREAVRAAEARAAAATLGRRRFFGPVLLQPARVGDWAGEVWLLDPERKGRGTGLRFSSLAEVRSLHPELWVVSVTADGILLDAWGGA